MECDVNKTFAAMAAFAAFALSGCGPTTAEACDQYFDAWDACLVEYYDAQGLDYDSSMGLSDDYCETTYGTTNVQASTDILLCYVEEIEAHDCSDSTPTLTGSC